MPIFKQNPKLVFLEERVKGILLHPKDEWDKIANTDAATTGDIFKNYVVILAAIPSVCGFLGATIFGYGLLYGVFVRPSITSALIGAVFSYILRLIGVFLAAYVINVMAPIFYGEKNDKQAFKVAAYSGTAAWLAGIFSIIPAFSILGLVGLYSVYLLYLGLPRLMKAPSDRAIPYTAAIVLVTLIIILITNYITIPLMHYNMH